MRVLTWITLAALLFTGGILWSRRLTRQVVVIPAPNRSAQTKNHALTTRPPGGSTPAQERFQTPWNALNARDYAAFVELLRQSGCPEDTVRIFAIAALGREYQRRVEQPQREGVRAATCWREDWRNHGVSQQAEFAQASRRQRAEMDQTLSRLLNVSIHEIRQDLNSLHEPRDWLPDDRREQLTALLARHQTEADAIEQRGIPETFGTPLKESLRNELKTLRERHRAELEQLLGQQGLADYEARESMEANYVRLHLPEAKNEEEFRTLVRAARDVGFTQSEIETDTLPHGLRIERPDLKKRVLARFREISDPNRAAELQDAAADASSRAEEERKAQEEADSLVDLQRLAKSGGVDLSADEARLLSAAIRQRGGELDHELGDPGKLPQAQQDALMQRLRIDFEKAAMNAVGEKKGRAIADQMWKERDSVR
jgi:hypothetical protein